SMRFRSGRIAKYSPEALRLRTPTARINVRGTLFIVNLESPDAAGGTMVKAGDDPARGGASGGVGSAPCPTKGPKADTGLSSARKQADARMKEGLPHCAWPYLQHLLAKRPQEARLLAQSASVAEMVQRFDEALKLHRMGATVGFKGHDSESARYHNGRITELLEAQSQSPSAQSTAQTEAVKRHPAQAMKAGTAEAVKPDPAQAMTAAADKPFKIGSPERLHARLQTLRTQAESGRAGDALTRIEPLCHAVAAGYGPHHEENAACLAVWGAIALDARKLGQAQRRLTQAAALQQVLLEPHQAARITTTLDQARLHRLSGDFPKALARLKGLIPPPKTLGSRRESVHHAALDERGRLHLAMGRYAEAEQDLRRVMAFESAQHGADSANAITAREALGSTLAKLERFSEAAQLLDQALGQSKTRFGALHPVTLALVNNLGAIYENQGLYQKAEPLFRHAVKSARTQLGEKHPTTLAALQNLALLMESQGRFDQALHHHGQSIGMAADIHGQHHPTTLAMENNLAYLHLLKGDHAKAAERFEVLAAKLGKHLGEGHPTTLKAINNLGRALHGQKRYKAAETHLQSALKLRRRHLGPKHRDVVRSLIDLGALHHDQARHDSAGDHFTKAIKLGEATLGPGHPYIFEALNGLASVREAQRDHHGALDLRLKGFHRRNDFLRDMLWVTGENARHGYIQRHKGEQDALLSLLGRFPDAQRAGEAALAVGVARKGLLLHVTATQKAAQRQHDDPKLADLTQRLHKTKKRLTARTLAGRALGETHPQHLAQLAGLEEEIDDLQMQLGRYGGALGRMRSASVPKLVEQLPEGAVLVDYLFYRDRQEGEKQLLAGVVRKQGGKVRYTMRHLGAANVITQEVRDLREMILDGEADLEEVVEAGQAVYNRIWAPLEPLAAAHQTLPIFVAPDGVLNLLPFTALVDGDERYLVESRTLRMLTSSRDMIHRRSKTVPGTSLIIAGPDYESQKGTEIITAMKNSPERAEPVRLGMQMAQRGMRGLRFDPLPGARMEGELVVKRMTASRKKPRLIHSQQAEEKHLQGLEHAPEILHVATHGFYLQADESLKKRLLKAQSRGADGHTPPPPGDNPLIRSGLVFAGVNKTAPFLGQIDTANDGILTAMEAVSLPLDGTRLVVLSACETGLGEVRDGEGVYGLRRAFQEAGAKAVIASLWEVSDAGTMALMDGLFKRMMKGVPVHEALRESQLALIKSRRWSSPYIWSAFLLAESGP
ncbi:MAG: CHAT domain-containing protein, partial [Magnetococcales bacterium]|nr:CHAT domain-containing protein [Magnetococcales bacterium]